jgi:hypothetical protein
VSWKRATIAHDAPCSPTGLFILPRRRSLPAGIDSRRRSTLSAASGSQGDGARGGFPTRRNVGKPDICGENRPVDGHLTCGLTHGSDQPPEIGDDRGP